MKKKVIIISCVCSVLLLALGIWKFTEAYAYSSVHFAPNTTINGVDCSDLTVDQATEKLIGEWNTKTLTIKEGETVLGTVDGFDFEYEIKDAVTAALNPSVLRPFLQLSTGKQQKITLPMKVKATTPAFDEAIAGYTFLDNDFTVKTEDAYVDMSNTDFAIVKEVYGDNVDRERFKAELLSHIEKGNFEIAYKAEDYYALPALVADSKALIAKQEYAKKYLTQSITYEFHNGKETLKPSELNELFTADEKGEITINEEAVGSFVSSLAARHNTVGKTRSFNSTTDGVISVSGGNYGYVIDKSGEAEQLAADIKEKKDVSRPPLYARKPYSGGENEIGTSYVEIDLSAQAVWLYKNGSQVLSTPIVTGNVAKGVGTPTGVYGITYLERNTTLRGKDFDGTQYESPVSYWMPFNGGIGLHDAPWRQIFGGTAYESNGSHGCVNMPPDAAATLFNNISKGFPVVVHN
ncbi:MAG: L,D-transpeptidase family protein [Anaerovoracaceae bacterium]